MLSNILNTNEIKNSAGVEQEFHRLSQGVRDTEYALITEGYATPHRMSIGHMENGAGLKKRRRSKIRFDLTQISDVDNVTPVTTSVTLVLDTPVGALLANTSPKTVLANLMSFVANTGADTAIKFDGSGTGAQVLLTGGI